jgi:hypothetical protein
MDSKIDNAFDKKQKDAQINMSKTFFHKRMNHSIVADGTKLLLNDYSHNQINKK